MFLSVSEKGCCIIGGEGRGNKVVLLMDVQDVNWAGMLVEAKYEVGVRFR